MTHFKIIFQTEETAKFFALNFMGDEDYINASNMTNYDKNMVVIGFKEEFADEAEMMIWGYANYCGFDSQIVSVEEL